MAKLLKGAFHGKRTRRSANASLGTSGSPRCGPAHNVDEGMQLFAGILIMARCAAFVGTLVSNLGSAIVELMATVRHPPVFFDLLGDMYRPFPADEQVWGFGQVALKRPSGAERLAHRSKGGAGLHQEYLKNKSSMVLNDLIESNYFETVPEWLHGGLPRPKPRGR